MPSARFDDLLAMVELHGPNGADTWAGNPARKQPYDPFAFAHFRREDTVPVSLLREARFTYDSRLALPMFEQCADPADAALSRIADSAASAAASGLASLSSQESAHRAGKLPGGTLTTLNGRGLEQKQPPPAASSRRGFGFAVLLQHWSIPPPLPESVAKVVTHHPANHARTEASKLTPLLQGVSKAAAAASSSDGGAAVVSKSAMLDRLVTGAGLEKEFLTKMHEKSSKKPQPNHHSNMPSLKKVRLFTDEVALRECSERYFEEPVARVLREEETRDNAVATVVEALHSGTLGVGGTTGALSDEDCAFLRRWERVEQLRAHAERLKAEAGSLYDANEPGVVNKLSDAVAAFERLGQARRELEEDETLGFVAKASATDMQETVEATGFKTVLNPAELFSKITKHSRDANSAHVVLVQRVRRAPKLASDCKQQVVAKAKGDFARQGIAVQRARREAKPKHADFPTDSCSLPFDLNTEAVYDACLVHMKVVYRATLTGDWRDGEIQSYDSRTQLYTLKLDGAEQPASVEIRLDQRAAASKVRYLRGMLDPPTRLQSLKPDEALARYMAAGGALAPTPTSTSLDAMLAPLSEADARKVKDEMEAVPDDKAPPVCERAGERIQCADFQKLRSWAAQVEGKDLWLNDVVMNAFGRGVISASAPKARVWRTGFLQLLLRKDHNISKPMVARQVREAGNVDDLFAIELWIFSGYDGTMKKGKQEGHWYVVVADFVAQQILALDSCGHARESAIRAVQLLIFDLHSKREKQGTRPFSFVDWAGTSLLTATPQQDTWWDCGVHALLTTWQLARRLPITKATEASINHAMGTLRQRMALCLLLGDVP